MAATCRAVGYVSLVDWCRLMSSSGLDVRVVAQRPAEDLQGPVGQHLVDVHVGAGARPALEGVDDDVLVEQALHHLAAGLLDRGRPLDCRLPIVD